MPHAPNNCVYEHCILTEIWFAHLPHDQASPDAVLQTVTQVTIQQLIQASIPVDQTIDIDNPDNGIAFWLSSLKLEQDFLTLEESALKDLKVFEWVRFRLPTTGFRRPW